jgi:hypothetical protein
MKTATKLPIYFCVILSLLTPPSWAQEMPLFDFFFQGIYSDKVTLNRVQQVFHDFSATINQPIHFNSGPSIEHIKTAITKQSPDLIMWGYSDELNDVLINNDYRQLVSSPLDINMYRYEDAGQKSDDTLRIAVLRDSTAQYSAESYYKEQNKSVDFIPFDDFFMIIQACLRKEIDVVIAAKTFLTPQPNTIQKRFAFVMTLPDHAKVSVWVKSNLNKKRQELIAQYFISHQAIYKHVFDAIGFQKVL